MCGIIGYVGPSEAYPILLEGLGRLEYRGYDSAGVATIVDSGKLEIRRAKGKLENLRHLLAGSPLHGHIGIGHNIVTDNSTACIAPQPCASGYTMNITTSQCHICSMGTYSNECLPKHLLSLHPLSYISHYHILIYAYVYSAGTVGPCSACPPSTASIDEGSSSCSKCTDSGIDCDVEFGVGLPKVAQGHWSVKSTHREGMIYIMVLC